MYLQYLTARVGKAQAGYKRGLLEVEESGDVTGSGRSWPRCRNSFMQEESQGLELKAWGLGFVGVSV